MSESSSSSHQGKVVSVSGDEITSTCSNGERHVHAVSKDTRVTCDGKPSEISELKEGDSIRVTLSDKNTVVSIESAKHTPAKTLKS